MSGFMMPQEFSEKTTTRWLISILIALLGTLLALWLIFLYLTRPLAPEAAPERISNEFINAIYGTGRQLLVQPSDVAIDTEGNIHIADTGNARIAVFDTEGVFLRAYGVAGEGELELGAPSAIALSTDGRSYVIDGKQGKLLVFDTEGKAVKAVKFAEEPPIEITVGPSLMGEESLYVTTRSGIAIGSLDGRFTFGYFNWGKGLGQFDSPTGIDVTRTSLESTPTIYVSDSLNYRIQAITDLETSPTVVWSYGQPLPKDNALRYEGPDRRFGLPVDIVANKRGSIFVVDGLSSQIVVLDASNGRQQRVISLAGTGDGALYYPRGISYFNDRLAVADTYNNRISIFADDPQEATDPQAPERRFTIAPQWIALGWLLLILMIVLGIARQKQPRYIVDIAFMDRVRTSERYGYYVETMARFRVAHGADIVAREALKDTDISVYMPHAKLMATLRLRHPDLDEQSLLALATALRHKHEPVIFARAELRRAALLEGVEAVSYQEAAAYLDSAYERVTHDKAAE